MLRYGVARGIVDGVDLQRLVGAEEQANTDVEDVLVGILVPHRGEDTVSVFLLIYDARPLAVGYKHCLQLVADKGKLGAILGNGRK
jgi:hypothetical protein